MKIRVRYGGLLRSELGAADEDMEIQEEITLKELIVLLSKKYSTRFERKILNSKAGLCNPAKILINQKDTNDLNQKVTDGSEIMFLVITPICGG